MTTPRRAVEHLSADASASAVRYHSKLPLSFLERVMRDRGEQYHPPEHGQEPRSEIGPGLRVGSPRLAFAHVLASC